MNAERPSPRFRSVSLPALLAAVALLALAAAAAPASAAEGQPLLRFPAIHGDLVVFVHGEDLWSVPVEGGVARRLTLNDGEERFPRFSPDGKWIAFTGEYDGNQDVYVMTTEGGKITRVTWHPENDEVVGWHPTKNKILFSSFRDSWSRFPRLFLISPDGSGLERLILIEAANGSFSADGSQIAFNKGTREFRTWKRYQGGLAQEVYLYDFTTNEERNLTNFRGTDRQPMWIGDKVYFSSDRDGVLNIYSVDPRSGAIEQVTHHTEYDVRRPSAGGNRIVYEVGGALWVLDVTTGETREIPVQIRADDPEARPYYKDVADFITEIDVSPSGKRALLVARGDLFSVPAEHGPTRNLTASSGARDRGAAWSPDGKTVAYVSDAGGEYDIWLADAQGQVEPVRLTHHDSGYRHALRWSPDGTKIGFTDQTLALYYVDVATRKITKVDQAKYENVDVGLDAKAIFDYAWSPDGRFIAYSMMDADLVYKIRVYSLESGESRLLSDGLFNDFNPVFTPDGEHLLFVSNRRFDPTFCDFEWEMVYKKVAGIYAVTLRRDGPRFLPLRSDEEGPEGGPDEDAQKQEAHEKKPAPRVRIDFEGIAARTEPLPLPRGNYRDLAVTCSRVYYLDADEGDFNRFDFRPPGPRTLYAFNRETREASTIAEQVDLYKLSADGSHIVYKSGPTIKIVCSASGGGPADYGDDAHAQEGGPDGEEDGALDLADVKMLLDPRAEWRQIFDEAWRMERDFYYEPGMHGLDWPAMREKYGRLMDNASCRQDARFIIGELIGELNTSHTYVYGGDRRREAEEVSVGMLGVDWALDEDAGRYRIGRILRVPDWTQEILPPLAGPAVDAREGDYLLQVNGVEVTADRNVYSYFQDLAGKQVTLLLNDRPVKEGARQVTVEPLPGERTLRYLDWVERNRRIADERSGGRIGYLHLPDTYTGSAREFPKYYYAQMRKEGLIVDGRFNGGGLDPDIFLQRLMRKPLAYFTRRYSHDQTIPPVVNNAHLALLTNRQAGSGGDMLPMEFQMQKLGPVIGTRTWGGLVGVSMFIQMVDGGGLTAPDYRIYDPQGGWIVENEGVTPDIEVDLSSPEMARGHDAQLETAIDYLLKKIEEGPRPWPQHGPYPRQ